MDNRVRNNSYDVSNDRSHLGRANPSNQFVSSRGKGKGSGKGFGKGKERSLSFDRGYHNNYHKQPNHTNERYYSDLNQDISSKPEPPSVSEPLQVNNDGIVLLMRPKPTGWASLKKNTKSEDSNHEVIQQNDILLTHPQNQSPKKKESHSPYQTSSSSSSSPPAYTSDDEDVLRAKHWNDKKNYKSIPSKESSVSSSTLKKDKDDKEVEEEEEEYQSSTFADNVEEEDVQHNDSIQTIHPPVQGFNDFETSTQQIIPQTQHYQHNNNNNINHNHNSHHQHQQQQQQHHYQQQHSVNGYNDGYQDYSAQPSNYPRGRNDSWGSNPPSSYQSNHSTAWDSHSYKSNPAPPPGPPPPGPSPSDQFRTHPPPPPPPSISSSSTHYDQATRKLQQTWTKPPPSSFIAPINTPTSPSIVGPYVQAIEDTNGILMNGINCEMVTISNLPWDWTHHHIHCLLVSVGVAAIDLRKGLTTGSWIVALHPTGGVSSVNGGNGNCHQALLLCPQVNKRSIARISFMVSHYQFYLLHQTKFLFNEQNLIIQSTISTPHDSDISDSKLDKSEEINEQQQKKKKKLNKKETGLVSRLFLMNLPILQKSPSLKSYGERIIQVIKNSLLNKDELQCPDLTQITFHISFPNQQNHYDGCAYLSLSSNQTPPSQTSTSSSSSSSSSSIRDKVASLIVKLDGQIETGPIENEEDEEAGNKDEEGNKHPHVKKKVKEASAVVDHGVFSKYIAVIPDPYGYDAVEVASAFVDLPRCDGGIDPKEVMKVKAHLSTKCGLTPRELKLAFMTTLRVSFPGTGSKAQSALNKLLALHGSSIPGLGQRGSLIHVSRCQKVDPPSDLSVHKGSNNSHSNSNNSNSNEKDDLLKWKEELQSWLKLTISKSQASRLLNIVGSSHDDVYEEDRLDARALLKNCLIHIALPPSDPAVSADMSGVASFMSSSSSSSSSSNNNNGFSGRQVWMIKDVIEVSGVFGLKIMHGGSSLSIAVNQLSEVTPNIIAISHWYIAAKIASRLELQSAIPIILNTIDEREIKRKKLAMENRNALMAKQTTTTTASSNQMNTKPSLSSKNIHTSNMVSVKQMGGGGKRKGKGRGNSNMVPELVAVGTVKRDRRSTQEVIRDKAAKIAAKKRDEVGKLFDSDDDSDNDPDDEGGGGGRNRDLDKDMASTSSHKNTKKKMKLIDQSKNQKEVLKIEDSNELNENSTSFADDAQEISWGTEEETRFNHMTQSVHQQSWGSATQNVDSWGTEVENKNKGALSSSSWNDDGKSEHNWGVNNENSKKDNDTNSAWNKQGGGGTTNWGEEGSNWGDDVEKSAIEKSQNQDYSWGGAGSSWGDDVNEMAQDQASYVQSNQKEHESKGFSAGFNSF